MMGDFPRGERMFTLVAFLQEYSLKLSSGAHTPKDPADPACKVCLQEAEALRIAWAHGSLAVPDWWKAAWSDKPRTCWADLRKLNDARWSSDEIRTLHLAPLEDRLREVPMAKRLAVVRRVTEHHAHVLLPTALRAAADLHPDPVHQTALREAADRCTSEGTATDAADAATAACAVWAAARAAARVAIVAKDAAGDAAKYAACAARATADAARATADAAAYAAAARTAYAADNTVVGTTIAVCAAAAAVATAAVCATVADAADAALIEAVNGWNEAITRAMES